MWQICQMPNIWHICHTKHKKHQISDELNLIIFATCEQYHCKFATVWNRYGISFNPFLFSFLSPLSSLYSFLFSLILPQTSCLSILFFTLFSSQSRCFSLFLSDITLSFFFSFFSSFTPISVAVGFFFFFGAVI